MLRSGKDDCVKQGGDGQVARAGRRWQAGAAYPLQQDARGSQAAEPATVRHHVYMTPHAASNSLYERTAGGSPRSPRWAAARIGTGMCSDEAAYCQCTYAPDKAS